MKSWNKCKIIFIWKNIKLECIVECWLKVTSLYREVVLSFRHILMYVLAPHLKFTTAWQWHCQFLNLSTMITNPVSRKKKYLKENIYIKYQKYDVLCLKLMHKYLNIIIVLKDSTKILTLDWSFHIRLEFCGTVPDFIMLSRILFYPEKISDFERKGSAIIVSCWWYLGLCYLIFL